MVALLAILKAVFVRLISLGLGSLCSWLTIPLDSAKLDTAANAAAVALAIVVSVLLERYLPKLWTALKEKLGGRGETLVLIVVAGLLAVGAMGGCAATEKNRIGQAYTALDATAGTTTTLLANKTITLAQAETVYRHLVAARDAIDAWDRARAAGSADLEKFAAAAQAALLQLNTEYVRATAPKESPMSIAAQLLVLAIQLQPSISKWIDLQAAAQDLSDADLQALKDHAHMTVASLGEAIAAAKSAGR